MTIFKDINELKMCVLEMEEYFPNEYISILGHIEKIKKLDLDDKTKQTLCNGELRKVLIKNKVIPSYKIVEWLSERREEYLDRLAYFQRENEWKKKKKLSSNTD
jgi:ATP sulfurylase